MKTAFIPVELTELRAGFWLGRATLDGVRLAWFGGNAALVLHRAHSEIARRVVAAALARAA